MYLWYLYLCTYGTYTYVPMVHTHTYPMVHNTDSLHGSIEVRGFPTTTTTTIVLAAMSLYDIVCILN